MPRFRDWLGTAPWINDPSYVDTPLRQGAPSFMEQPIPNYSGIVKTPNFYMGKVDDIPEDENGQPMLEYFLDPGALPLPYAPESQDASLKMNELRNYIGAPRNSRRSDNMHMSSMESGMPTDRPYPGESYEAFMARMAAEGQGPAPVMDPRAAALAQMMGNPATNPANTYNMGRTTENFYDQPPAYGPEAFTSDQLVGMAPGTMPVEELIQPEMDAQEAGGMTGTDAFMADAYGAGYDAYANGLPGSEGPPTRMQMRNRMVANPGESEDDIEQAHMLGMHELMRDSTEKIGPDGDGPKTNDTDNDSDSEPDSDADDTEGELNMVQEQIGKAGQTSDELTGDEQGDADYLDSVATDVLAGYREQEELDRLIRRFESKYGYTPELTGQEDSERDNAD